MLNFGGKGVTSGILQVGPISFSITWLENGIQNPTKGVQSGQFTNVSTDRLEHRDLCDIDFISSDTKTALRGNFEVPRKPEQMS